MNRKSFYAAILGMALAGVSVPFASAQNAGGGAPAGGQGGGQRGGAGGGAGGPGGQRWNPEEMRARMATRMKEQLGVTDEEWTALQPKVEKVQQLQMQSRSGGRGFGGFGGRGGGPGGDTANQPTNPVATASQELQTLLENKDANPEQIKARLTALRDARTKAREELTKAQAELKELLTVRQEAVLVSMGMLD